MTEVPGRGETRIEAVRESIIALYFSLPMLLVALAVASGPSPSERPLPAAYAGLVVPIGAVFAVLGLLGGRFILSRRGDLPFALALSAYSLVLVAASIWLGVSAHRDFFTAAFQYLFAVPTCILYHVAFSAPNPMKKSLQRGLANACLVIAFFYTEWIMLMGYAIATRAEPRPIESLIYNVYNLGQDCVVILLSRMARLRTFHTLDISGEGLSIDGRDMANMLSPKEAHMLRAFAAAPDRSLTCGELQRLFRERPSNVAPAAEDSCAGCSEQTTKAALCPKYRSTYNGVLNLKRILEFLEIGSITAPGNKRRVLAEGWKLSLFEDVRIAQRKKERERRS